LLITDVMMPDINGRVLAETLTAVRPEMKMLYTSGNTGDVCVEKGELEPGCHFWANPSPEPPWRKEYARASIRRSPDVYFPSSSGSEVE
jgi:CheY-like chemotaxis protein